MGIKRENLKILEIGRCENCGGLLRDPGYTTYICSRCGHQTISEYGKIKNYIEENGSATAAQISAGTGIPISKIDKYLREGRIEIPEGSDVFIKCMKCGTDIRYGRYCSSCASQLTKQLQSAIMPTEVGEKPKKQQGKMRYLTRDTERH